ncbi:DDE-type integrase/transposase/recombinase [Streptomyces sp. NPDC058391]|uniref:DDE-type integrase/transposase/recombinase n=1 Tax=Streptomyces sp. NPDC058391 TaxID=3346476 RepID=UPI00364DB82A
MLWTADITYVPTGEGRPYLAVVPDLSSRRIVSWAIAGHMRTELVTEALALAVTSRRPRPERDLPLLLVLASAHRSVNPAQPSMPLAGHIK